MSGYDDYCERPEFYHETFPKAAKVHNCCECNAKIEIGEQHLYARAKTDGDFWCDRQHLLCREACMRMNEIGEGCCAFGGMFDEYAEDDTLRADESLAHLMALIADREGMGRFQDYERE